MRVSAKADYAAIATGLNRRYANNWQGLVSYTFNDAEGNTNSDSNADFAGGADNGDYGGGDFGGGDFGGGDDFQNDLVASLGVSIALGGRADD